MEGLRSKIVGYRVLHKNLQSRITEHYESFFDWFTKLGLVCSPGLRMSDRQDSGIRIHVYGYLCIPERSRTQPGFNQVQSGMVHIHMYTCATLWNAARS